MYKIAQGNNLDYYVFQLIFSRLERKIRMSDDSSVVLFWWSTSGHEVFPWTPQLRDEDRANVMLFSLKNPAQPVRLGYVRTHTDPIGFR